MGLRLRRRRLLLVDDSLRLGLALVLLVPIGRGYERARTRLAMQQGTKGKGDVVLATSHGVGHAE